MIWYSRLESSSTFELVATTPQLSLVAAVMSCPSLLPPGNNYSELPLH